MDFGIGSYLDLGSWFFPPVGGKGGTDFTALESNPLPMFSFSTRVHAALDYSFSLFLMLSPAIFGFGEAEAETIVPIVAGVVICFYSFFTNYDGGLYHLFSLKLHYLLDLFIGLFIMTSPWLFGFNDFVSKPHFYIGLSFSILALISLLPLIKWKGLFLHKHYGDYVGSH